MTRKLDNAGCARLGLLTGLRWVDLSGSAITDTGMQSLSALVNLTNLNVMTLKLMD